MYNINSVYFELTNRCNYSCTYCYNDSNAKNGIYLSADVFKNTIQALKPFGLSRVALSGGEPLLHPKIKEIIEYNYHERLSQILITNSSLLTDEHCELFTQFKDREFELELTLDGPNREINDKNRGKGSFYDFLNAYKRLLKYDLLKQVILRCNLSFENIDYARDTAELVQSLGFNNITYSLLNTSGRANRMRLLDSYQDAEKIKVLDQIVEDINTKGKISASFDHRVAYICPYQKMDSALTLKIDSEGNVFPCQSMMDKRFALENICRDDFSVENICKNISKFVHYLNARLTDEKTPCSQCAFQNLCSGGCLADVLNRTGNIYGVDKSCIQRKQEMRQAILLRNIKDGI